MVDAAVLVLMSRDANDGWNDPEVAAALSAFARGIDCAADGSAVSTADGALRLQSRIYGYMLDRAYAAPSPPARITTGC